jgi:hypothetical protein
MKKITTKRVLIFLLLLIKLAIFPHIGIFFIIAAAQAAEPSYRLVIMTEPDSLNITLGRERGDKDFLFRMTCGTADAIAWGKRTIFKGRPWMPITLTSLRPKQHIWDTPCDSKIVGTGGVVLLKYRENSDRLCPRVEGCVINLDALSEEEYCPTCVWKNSVN